MSAIKDLTGLMFGMWTVVERGPNKDKNHLQYLCRCECGTERLVQAGNLRSGASTNCGCMKREKAIAMNTTHGMSKTPEHRTWKGIRERCYNKNKRNYHHYGGRGIKMSKEWYESFEVFLSDMGLKPSSEHSIERIDVDGDYCKENCVWATKTEQARNKRVRESSGTGVIGVTKSGKSFRARISVNKKVIYLGLFKSLDDAIEARKKAELLMWDD